MGDEESDPSFFLDRNLGSRIIPEGLRARGWHLTTMDERYGYERSQEIADIDWIRESSERGECIITKDTAIARSDESSDCGSTTPSLRVRTDHLRGGRLADVVRLAAASHPPRLAHYAGEL